MISPRAHLVQFITRAVGLCYLLLCLSPACAAISVRASFDRSTVMAGETALFQIIVQGGQPQAMENFTNIPGLTIQQRGNQQNISMVNGVTTATFTLNFAVTAAQPGDYIIPAVRLTVDGTTHTTQPVKLTVTRADPSIQNKYAFLKLNVPRDEIYIGEVMPIEIQLYVVRAEGMQAPRLNSPGFIIHKEPQHTTSSAQIGSTSFNVLTFPKSISAAKAGTLALGPAQMDVTLLFRSRSDPNDPFGEFFGRAFQKRTTSLTSNTNLLKVLPLPPNAPAEFSGAIGQFNWSVEASPRTVNAGDPITLRIRISGEGNLDAITLPKIDWPDFNSYQPNSTVEASDPLGLRGSKSFELVVVPQNTGIQAVPGLKWSFFDPKAKKYTSLAQPAIPIVVNAGAAGQATPTVLSGAATATDQPEQRQDIVHIKPEFGPLAQLSPPWTTRPWFFALQAIPLLAFTAVALWRKRQDELAANPKLRRRLEVQQYVGQSLQELQRLAAENNSEAFYALVFRLLQEQLGERLSLPASAITEAVLDEHLPARGASPSLIAQLHQLFQLCNMARYAPVATNEQLNGVRTQLETALHELQALPD